MGKYAGNNKNLKKIFGEKPILYVLNKSDLADGKADAFLALSDVDEENILLSLFAENNMSGKIITKINRIEFDSVIRKLELDSIINPKSLTAENIVRYVRAMKNTIGSNVETLYGIIKDKVEAAEFIVREPSKLIGKPLMELKFKKNLPVEKNISPTEGKNNIFKGRMKKALFIDRDGTLIKEPADEQIDSFEKLEFVPKVIKNLGFIRQHLDYEFVMVSNQDGLGTDAFPEDTFWPAHNLMMRTLEGEGVTFDDVLIDRSFPADNAPTRKPRTGLLTAYMDGTYDLPACYVIGDRATDVELAKNLGCRAIYLQDTTEELPAPLRIVENTGEGFWRAISGLEDM